MGVLEDYAVVVPLNYMIIGLVRLSWMWCMKTDDIGQDVL
jgi:hypothetical protein